MYCIRIIVDKVHVLYTYNSRQGTCTIVATCMFIIVDKDTCTIVATCTCTRIINCA